MRRPKYTEAVNLLIEIADKHNISIERLKNRKNMAKHSKAIQEFCEKGREINITIVTLATVLGRDHTTISYHANAKMRQRKLSQRPPYRGRTPEQRYRLKLTRIARETREETEQ